jgi:virginiamycin B lyase
MFILVLVLLLSVSCGGQDSAKNEKAGMQSAGRVAETLLGVRNSTQFMAVGAGSLWLANPDHGTITRIDLEKNEVVAQIKVSKDPQSVPGGADPQSVAASGDQVWFTDRAREAVSRIDPKTNRIVERIPVGTAIYDIAIDGDILWLTDFDYSVVLRLDTNKKRVVSEIYGLDEPTGITLGAGSVWTIQHDRGVVARIDPKTNEVVEETVVGTRPENIAFGAGGVWTADGVGGDSVSPVDPKTHKEVAPTIKTSLPMYGVAVGGGSVWAAGSPLDCASIDEGALVRIDPTTNKIVGRTHIRCASGVETTDDAVWVVSSDVETLTRVEPTR